MSAFNIRARLESSAPLLNGCGSNALFAVSNTVQCAYCFYCYEMYDLIFVYLLDFCMLCETSFHHRFIV